MAVGARVFGGDNLRCAGEVRHTRKPTAPLALGVERDRARYRYRQGGRQRLAAIAVQQETRLEERRVKPLRYDLCQQKRVPWQLFTPITAAYPKAYETTRTDGWWRHHLFTAPIKNLAPAPRVRATARLGKGLASKFCKGIVNSPWSLSQRDGRKRYMTRGRNCLGQCCASWPGSGGAPSEQGIKCRARSTGAAGCRPSRRGPR